MSLHFPLPKIRTFHFSLHTSHLSFLKLRFTIVVLKFAMSAHFPLPKNFALFVLTLSSGATVLPIEKMNQKIPLVSNTRLLGVIVDSNLSWKDHVDQVCLKVNRKIGALRRSFRQLVTPTARLVFFLGDTARSRICSFSHRTKHGSFTKESSPSNLGKGGSVCSRKWPSGQCGTPCKTVKDSFVRTSLGPASGRDRVALQPWLCSFSCEKQVKTL